jgi:hypothetical protein
MTIRFATCVTLAAVIGAWGCSSAAAMKASGGHSLMLTATLTPDDGQLAFLTPAASIVDVPTASIVGKPYLVASFHAGFSPGNDPAIDHTWGIVPDDLRIQYTTPATYADGAYDVVLVVYASTPITPAIEAAPAQSAPAAKKGDLATFTADNTVVRAGDPSIALGTVRFNVEGANATVSVQNRTPANPSDSAEMTAALANTIMVVP